MCSQQTYVFYVQAYSLSEDNAEHRIDTRWDSRLKTTKHVNKIKETTQASINLSRWPAKRQSSKRVVILLYRNDRMSLRYVQNEQKCNSNKEKKKELHIGTSPNSYFLELSDPTISHAPGVRTQKPSRVSVRPSNRSFWSRTLWFEVWMNDYCNPLILKY